jgi:hypothetical protein
VKPDLDLGFNPAVVADFEAEITRTLVAGGLMDPPTRVLLCGTLAHEPAVAAAAERVMGVPPEVVSPMEDLGAPGPEALAAVSALGAAWKGLGFDHAEVNLRVDEFAFKRRFDQVAGALATFVTLAFLVLLVLLIDTKQRYGDLRREWTLKVLRPAFARFTETLNKMEADESKRAALTERFKDEGQTPREKVMGRMVGQLRQWKTKLQGGPAKSEFQMRSALDTWKAWSDPLMTFEPRPKYWVLDQIEIELKPPPSQGRIYCKGWVDIDKGREAIERMKNSVTALPDFTDTVPGVTTAGNGPDGEQRLSFSLTTTLPLEASGKSSDKPGERSGDTEAGRDG